MQWCLGFECADNDCNKSRLGWIVPEDSAGAYLALRFTQHFCERIWPFHELVQPWVSDLPARWCDAVGGLAYSDMSVWVGGNNAASTCSSTP